MDKVEQGVNGRSLSIETGRIAKQAGGSVLVQYGETAVLVAATASKEPLEGLDFFPLTVEYRERAYAAGKIPGGFFKREGRPMDLEILTSRLIDRPIRPLFPKNFRHEVQVIALVVSADDDNPSDIPAIIGASAALTLSDIPFDGPVGAVRIGRVDNRLIVNPTHEEMEKGTLNLTVAGTEKSIVMVECEAKEVPEEVVLEALELAHQEIRKAIQLQLDLLEKTGSKEKIDFEPPPDLTEYKEWIRTHHMERLLAALQVQLKKEREKALDDLKRDLVSLWEDEEAQTLAAQAFQEVEKEEMRRLILERGMRADGRGLKDIRPISIEVGLLPRAHGSALFTRGETQALVAVTLGTPSEEQIVDALIGESTKSFMVHYNFPPFSVGEVRPIRGVSRREVGHGALAERALKAVVPQDEAQFPYTIRVVSDILESNGSSSMATVCGGSLALMDAGVPVKKDVAGIAMGLVWEGSKYAILSDIMGMEDHLGDMDFKVAGTEDGITALQMDIKVEEGVPQEVLREALEQAKEGRLYILSKMREVLDRPRAQLSPLAPRILTIQVKPEKVREVIGPGGKTIKAIIDRFDVKIDVEDSGLISVAASSEEAAQKAIDFIHQLTKEFEPGEEVEGKVTRIEDYGVFIELGPGKEGLLHISQASDKRIRDIRRIFHLGDLVKVKILEIDDLGRVKLTRKGMEPLPGQAEEEMEPRTDRPSRPPRDRGDRGDKGRGPSSRPPRRDNRDRRR
ncbi:MAG: polyribonucleotide nucleotidyltransferase [Aquificota bacterium]|nr:MAG: polyribonucleotide nucleotidyltransferase [Aquificota bacterium]